MSQLPDTENMLWKERVANTPKHWVRAVTACNSRCLFCLDSDTPRNVYLPVDEIRRELDRGREQLGAVKVIISGGEATLHPAFPELVRYALASGYERVQTVTNGYRLADPEFFDACLDAGLGEITFSLHGHDAALHDRLTQTPGAFKRLIKGMVRALRDGRPIVNVDVVINKQNVAVLDKIVELCISLGVTEFDLLHVIPQAAAFEHRDELFYDVREHLPVLHKVFRLNRHPRFVVWTNRFPVSYLEGLEDLIQDPHKMLDEVNGRRFQVRRYLDEGLPLDCRHPERCPHCFIEPFCTSMDRVIEAQHAERFEVYLVSEVPAEVPALPYGCTKLGLSAGTFAQLPPGVGCYALLESAEPIPRELGVGREVTLVAGRPEQLDAWLGAPLPAGVELEIRLNHRTADWLLEHRGLLEAQLDRVLIHQPSHEHLQQAIAEDVRQPRAFFAALELPVRVSGLPPCQVPGAAWVPERLILDAALFEPETGRLAIRELARHHVQSRYRAKSVRCSECRVTDRCDGAAINMVRDQGLAILTPVTGGDAADAIVRRLTELLPEPPRRVELGAPPLPPSVSLPGYAAPGPAPPDPLAVIEQQRQAKARLRRRALPLVSG
ncbi:MAG: radical SAM protein [Polyangiaceae bacterium]|nr:radical SAM protein [Polyangiaceae bacterium]